MIGQFFSSLFKHRRRIFVISIALVVMLSAFTAVIFSKNFLPSSIKSTKDHVNDAEVLAEKTSDNLLGEITFNVPAIFNGKTFFNEDVKINNKNLDLGTGSISASNIIYSLRPGANISITGDRQNPTISASLSGEFVTSVQGQTGALTFVGGTGISVEGLTITNTDPGSAQNIFKTFEVGGTSITASSNTDTLQLEAGSGISLGVNGKTVTITNSSPGSSSTIPTNMDTNGIIYANSSSTITSLPPGNAGFILQSNGAGSPPSWVANSSSNPPFSAITSGTNTTAAMIVGSGASLDFSGSGTINASTLGGATFAAPGPIGSTTPSTGAFTSLNASGTVTFSGLSTGILHSNGAGLISSSAVNLASSDVSGILQVANGGTGANTLVDLIALGTDTTGNYVASLTGGSGVSVTGGTGEGATPSLALGALTSNWDQTGAFDIILNNANSELQILESTGGTFYGTIDVGNLSANRTYTFPDGAGTVCILELGNCGGGGGGNISGSGTSGQIAFFNGTNTITSETTGFSWDAANKKLGIGTDTPTGLLNVNGAPAGQALAVFNYTGSGQNILTASASGTTRLTLDASGNLNIIGGAYQIGGTNVLTSNTLGSGVVNSSLTSVGTITTGVWNGTPIGAQYGGTGLNTSASTGVPTISSGTWSILAALSAALGGTGDDTSGTTGVPYITGGNWQYEAALNPTRGGTGLSSYTTGDMIYASGTNTLNNLPIGANGRILTVSSGLPTWVDPGTAGINFWQRNNGALAPLNITDDLLVGSTATGSAKFAFMNVANGTPTASVSAGTNGATYLTADGTIATTAKQSLRLGSADTGSIILNGFGTGILHSNAAGVLSSSAVNLASGDVTGTLAIGNGGTGTATTPTNGQLLIGNGTGYTLAGLTGTTNQITVTNGSGTITLSTPQDIHTAATPTFASLSLSANTNQLTLGTGTTGTLTMTSLTGNRTYTLPDATGTVCLSTGNCAGAGGGITGSGTAGQIAFFNGSGTITSETSGFGWDSSNKKLSIGSGTDAKLQVTGASTGKALTIFNETGNQDIFSASSSGTTRFTIANDGTLTATKYTTNNGLLYTNGSGVVAQSNAGTSGQVLLSNSGTPTFTSLSGDIASVTGAGAVTLANVGTAGTYGSASQVPVFTTDAQGRVSSVTNTAIAIAASQITSGQLSSARGGTGADLSGAAQYSIPYFNPAGTMTTLAPSTAGYILTTNSTGAAPAWVDPASLGIVNYWDQLNGALRPKNSTVDFLVGGQASESAKFAVLNVNSGTPTASVSAGTAGAAYLTANGTLATTAKQSLRLGSTDTGSIVLNGFGAGILHSNASGVLSSSAVNLASSDVTGTLAIGNGGTGTNTTPTNGQLLIGNGTGYTLAGLTGTANQINVTNGSGTITLATPQNIHTGATPTFASLSLSANTNQLTLGTGTTGTVTMAALSGPQTYTLPDASGTVCLSTGNCNGGAGGSKWQVNGTVLAPLTPTNQVVLGGNTSTVHQFEVNGKQSGKALVSFNETGDQNIFTASASGATVFNLNRNGNLQMLESSGGTFFGTLAAGDLSSNQTYTLPNGTGTVCLVELGNCAGSGSGITGSGTATQIAFFSGGTQNLSSDSSLYWDNTNKLLGIGSSSPVAKLDVSGRVTGKALTILNETGNQDIFTASASGATRFTIANDGTLTATKYTTNNGLLYTNGSGVVAQSNAGTSGQVLLSNSGTPTFTSLSGDIASVTGAGAVTLANVGTAGTYGSASQVPVFTTDAQGRVSSVTNTAIAIAASQITSGQLSPARGGTGVDGSAAANGSLLIGNGSGYSLNTLTAGSGISITNGSGSITIAQTGGGASKWTQDNTAGTLTPNISTLDVLFGGTSTPSAKFGVLNMAGGTPTASLSAGTAGGAYLTADGKLATTAKQALTLGDATTNGSIVLANNTIFNSGTTITQNGTGQVTFGGNVDATNGLDVTNANLTVGGSNFTVNQANGNITTAGDLAVNGGDITTGGDLTINASGNNVIFADNNVLNVGGAAATAYNFFANSTAGSSLATGDSDLYVQGTFEADGAVRFDSSTLTLGNAAFANCSVLQTVSNAITCGNANLSNYWQLNSGAIAPFSNTLDVLFGDTASNSARMKISPSGTSPTASISAVSSYAGLVADNRGSGDLFAASSSGLNRFVIKQNGNVGIGTTNPTALLDVNGTITGTTLNGTTGINTGAGAGTQRIDSSGNLVNIGTITAGGLISANAGLTVASGQNTTLSSFTTNQNSVLYTNGSGVINAATTASTGLCLMSNTNTPAWATCPGASATNYWQLGNGAIAPFSNTLDVLFGDTASNAARMKISPNGTSPTASISAVSSYAGLVVDNRGSGDLFAASSSGLNRFVIKQNGNVGIGTTNPTALLDVNGTITGTTLNGTTGINTGAGAGTNRIDASGNLVNIGTITAGGLISANAGLTVASGQNLTLTNVNNNNSVLYANTSGVVTAVGTTSTANLCLLSGLNSAAPSWGACDTSAGVNLWQQNLGAISPKNATVDLLIGGQATASAKFAVTGINGSATPFASVSATTASGGTGTGISLGGDGSIQSLRNGNLTIGGNTTGRIVLSPGSGTGYVQNNGNFMAKSGGTESFNFYTTYNQDFDRWRFYNSSNDTMIRLNTNASGSKDGLEIINASAGDLFYGFVGYENTIMKFFGGADIPLTFGTNNVENIRLTSTNRLGINTPFPFASLDLRVATGAGTLATASISGQTSFAGLVVDNSGTGDLFTASSSGLNRFVITQNGNVGIGKTNPTALLDVAGSLNASGLISANAGLTVANGQNTTLSSFTTNQNSVLYTNGSGVINAATTASTGLCLMSNTNTPAWATCPGSGTNYWQFNSGAIAPFVDSVDTLFGGTSTASAKMKISPSGTSPTASIAAVSSYAGLVVNNSGSGDLFTASSSGLNRFVIKQNGNVGIGTTLPTANLHIVQTGLDSGFYLKARDNGLLDPYAFRIDDSSGNFAIGYHDDVRQTTIRGGTSVLDGAALQLEGSEDGADILRVKNGNVNVSYLRVNGLGTNFTASVSGQTAKAAMIVTNTGAGDLFTASSSGGINRFVIKNNGNVGIGNSNPTQALDVVGNATASGSLSLGGVFQAGVLGSTVSYNRLGYAASTHGLDSSSDLFISGRLEVDGSLFVDGNIIPGGTVGTVGWLQRNGGALAPTNITDDLLLGSTATTSAKFAFMNVAGGTPIASLSAGTAGGTYLTADGKLATTAKQTLTLGDSTTTGNVVMNPSGALLLTGNAASSLTTSTGSLTLTSAATTTWSTAGTNQGLTLSASGALTLQATGTNIASLTTTGAGTVNLGNTAATTINVGSSGNIARAINIGTAGTNTAQALALGSNSTGSYVTLKGATTTLNIANNFNFAGTDSSAPVATISGSTSNAGLILDNSGTGDLFVASSSGLNRFIIKQNGNVGIGTITPAAKLDVNGTIAAAGLISANAGLTVANGQNTTLSSFTTNQNSVLYTNGSGVINAATTASTGLCLMSNTNTPAWATCPGGGTNYWQLGSGSISPFIDSVDTLFGGTSTASAKMKISPSGTSPTASIAATSSYAGLVVNNSGAGDLFTASSSGLNRFVIKQNGNVGIGTTAPAEKLDVEGGNIRIGAQTNGTTAFAKKTQSTAGTFAVSGTPSINQASASAVFNGSLYVGTAKSNAAEIYRYEGGTSWLKVSQPTAGTIALGGTANIDAITAMTVYNGNLYVGTSEGNASAEIYRYDGGTTWTRVNSSAGTFDNVNGQTGIPTVSSMIVYRGRLFIGTKKSQKAELQVYMGGNTWQRINSTPGVFDATTDATTKVDAVTALAAYRNELWIGTSGPAKAGLYLYEQQNDFSVITRNFCGSGDICEQLGNNYDTVNAMIVFNGSLYASASKNGSGLAVVNIIGGMSGENPGEIVSQTTAGTIAIGGTTGIEAVTTMSAYNGQLYIGTLKANSAEVYRYNGPRNWTRVSNAAGTIASGGTPNIDSITSLQPFNGQLWAFTGEASSAEGYNYTNVSDQSYALTFDAFASSASGELNGFQNIGSISFVASQSATTLTGNAGTGGFLFSHGILTNFGGYDVAEDYGTRDETLEPGDLVAADPYETDMIKKASGSANTVLGVFSEKPGFRLSQQDTTINGGKAVPIALAGRVPLKVTTENGPIKPGDMLTASDTPGVAKKAIKAGPIVARSLGFYDNADTKAVGKVSAFINLSWYDPAISLSDSGNISVNGKELNGDTLKLALNDSKEYIDKKVSELTATNSANFQTFNNQLSLLNTNVASLGTQIGSLSARVSSLENNASSSALFSSAMVGFGQLNASSAAELGLDKLDAKEVTVGKTLSVVGRTTLADVGITGNVNIGLLTIKGLDTDGTSDNAYASINTSAGPLKLQSDGFNGIDFENGKLTIDTKGNLKTEGEITTKKVNIDTKDVAGASLGEATVKAGQTQVVIETTAVTDKSKIFITPKTKTALPLSVTGQTDGESFKVEIDSSTPRDIKFNWWIVN